MNGQRRRHYCVTVLDAYLWIHETVQKVKPSTVRAYFAKAGFTDKIIDEDPDNNVVPQSELIQAIESHLHIDDPMDAADYVTMDDDIPVADNNMDGCKVRILADLKRTDNSTSSKHGEEQSLLDDEVEEMPEKRFSER